MSSQRRPYLGGIILVTLGILFLLDNLGFASFGDIISTYWPVILILIGVRIFFRYGNSPTQPYAEGQHTVITGMTQESSASLLHSSNVFGDVDMKITSKDFHGGSISNTFGDMNIDLSEMQLADGEQLLKLDGVFGDLHVLVPKDMEIFVTAHSLFGDVRVLGNVKTGIGQELSHTTPSFGGSTKRLRLYCNQVFGDVRVW